MVVKKTTETQDTHSSRYQKSLLLLETFCSQIWTLSEDTTDGYVTRQIVSTVSLQLSASMPQKMIHVQQISIDIKCGLG
jgi:hypothetical protein